MGEVDKNKKKLTFKDWILKEKGTKLICKEGLILRGLNTKISNSLKTLSCCVSEPSEVRNRLKVELVFQS